jgi:hypothetical protein
MNATRKQHERIEQFVRRAKKIHGTKYNYSMVNKMQHGFASLRIICPIHGEFYRTSWNHIELKWGCPDCIEDKS